MDGDMRIDLNEETERKKCVIYKYIYMYIYIHRERDRMEDRWIKRETDRERYEEESRKR